MYVHCVHSKREAANRSILREDIIRSRTSERERLVNVFVVRLSFKKNNKENAVELEISCFLPAGQGVGDRERVALRGRTTQLNKRGQRRRENWTADKQEHMAWAFHASYPGSAFHEQTAAENLICSADMAKENSLGVTKVGLHSMAC